MSAFLMAWNDTKNAYEKRKYCIKTGRVHLADDEIAYRKAGVLRIKKRDKKG